MVNLRDMVGNTEEEKEKEEAIQAEHLGLTFNKFLLNNVQGREDCWRDFIKYRYMFNIILRQDTCKLICFKFGKMLDTTQLHSLKPI